VSPGADPFAGASGLIPFAGASGLIPDAISLGADARPDACERADAHTGRLPRDLQLRRREQFQRAGDRVGRHGHAATLPGFLPGQRGTISLDMIDPSNGLAVEIQRHPYILLAEDTYLAPEPFTLLIQDGPNPGSIELGTRPGVVQPSMPLPSNDLIGCGG
jgi:hypothetical protein